MSWRECESLLQLRKQVNELWPNRDKASDGTVGDLSHSQRKSDHNPNRHGVVTAMDIDRELGGQPDGSNAGDTVAILVSKLQASRDKRIKYLIWNAQITLPGDVTKWKPYHGANAHKHHMHISVSSDPALYDNKSEWHLTGESLPSEPVSASEAHLPIRDLKFGDKGADVGKLQGKLGVKVDEDFGQNTKNAVINVQKINHLTPDGIVGKNTRAILGL